MEKRITVQRGKRVYDVTRLINLLTFDMESTEVSTLLEGITHDFLVLTFKNSKDGVPYLIEDQYLLLHQLKQAVSEISEIKSEATE